MNSLKNIYIKAILTLAVMTVGCPLTSMAQQDSAAEHITPPPQQYPAKGPDSGVSIGNSKSPETRPAAGIPNKAAGAPPAADTTTHFWLHPYWGIGAGWGIGSFPLFSEWQKGLPDSSSDLVGENSEVPTFTIKEAATAYNVFWPVLLSYTPFTNKTTSLSVESSLYFIFTKKKFIAKLSNDDDTASRASINWEQSCAVYHFNLGMSYSHAIPEEYFKVDGVNKTSIVLGLSVTPLLHITNKASFSATKAADSTVAALQANVYNKTMNGAGFSWKAGISTLKRLSPQSGMEISLVYIGRWFGYIRDGSNRVKWESFNRNSASADRNISFLSSEIEINLVFQSGKKQGQ